jgi:hypothetical protein
MLSPEEKLKTELAEQYRLEVSSRLKAKPQIDVVEKITKILQGLAIIIGIWATYNEYKKQNDLSRQLERDRYEQTAKDFRKFFYQKQLDYYAEATDATATLATEEIGSKDYVQARKNFLRLFWGRLSIVEDSSVEARMLEFRDLLLQYENPNDTVSQQHLEQASLDLAHNASKYIINVWIDSTERSKFNR